MTFQNKHNEIILIKNGELALKGMNRHQFEKALIRNLSKVLNPLGEWKYQKEQSTIMIEPVANSDGNHPDINEAVDRVGRVFGIAAYSRACVTKKDFSTILNTTKEYLGDALRDVKTFKVEARRSDKAFELNSPEICRQTGAYLLKEFPNLSVDVHNPEMLVVIEIRDFGACIRTNQLRGAGGMPVGTSGRAALLISGGIDSPVAGYMMAKRGVQLVGIHFASPPYTSKQAEYKVKQLMQRLSKYSATMKFITVPFTKIQEQIKTNCEERYFTIIMRRFMMKISDVIGRNDRCGALITGESIGQVASQTMAALSVTEQGLDLPVFRPLIGLDKYEIVKISHKIDTYEVSIQPYDDCCTIFQPRRPATKPRLKDVLEQESYLEADQLIQEAVENATSQIIHAYA